MMLVFPASQFPTYTFELSPEAAINNSKDHFNRSRRSAARFAFMGGE